MFGKVMAVRLCDVILTAARRERLTFTRNITASNMAAFGFRRTQQLRRTNKLPEAVSVNKEESNIGNSFDFGSTTIHHLSEKHSCLPEEMKANRESNTTKVVKYGVDGVLVTGASGYIALHCAQQLLEMGYTVRGTVRNLRNSAEPPLRDLAHSSERLELVEDDLECPEHWPSAIEGCDYILHVASPWPIVADEHTITVVVQGTENVLKVAATVPTVKKIILTSSCAAINDGHKNQSRVFNEECWTNLESTKIENYARSKTLAERAAWDFWNSLDSGTRFQLTVVNPTLVVGPVLSDQSHGSATVITRLMDIRTSPAIPKVCLGTVDVRDVAYAHIVAMITPESDGERILVTATPSVWFADIAQWLNKEFKNQGYKISRMVVPNWLLRLYSKTKINPQISALIYRTRPELRFDNSKSKKLLKLEYRNPQ